MTISSQENMAASFEDAFREFHRAEKRGSTASWLRRHVLGRISVHYGACIVLVLYLTVLYFNPIPLSESPFRMTVAQAVDSKSIHDHVPGCCHMFIVATVPAVAQRQVSLL